LEEETKSTGLVQANDSKAGLWKSLFGYFKGPKGQPAETGDKKEIPNV